jgi:hypothetical protein
MFYSDAKQDCFVANMLNFKQTGFFLDIGSAHARKNNNTFHFDQIGWSGICVEWDKRWVDSYKERKSTRLINKDALRVDYRDLFNAYSVPLQIDYISLDVDEFSTTILQKLPLDKWSTKILTIEHDYYRFGDKWQAQQRDILTGLGYHLICADVFVEQPDFTQEKASFEDWWISPKWFDTSLVQKIESSHIVPSQIIDKFGDRKNWFR